MDFLKTQLAKLTLTYPTPVHYPRNASDVYQMTFLLRQVLIPDLIPQILDSAEYWVQLQPVTNQELTKVTEQSHSDASRLYLQQTLPSGTPSQSIRKVTFIVTSRDQGWSWDTKWHNTYEHSWTWFDAVVWETDVQGLTTIVKAENQRLITNVHAGKDFKTHTITWRWDTEKEEELKALKALHSGAHLGITVWARYGGWVNEVKDARIEIEVAAIHRG